LQKTLQHFTEVKITAFYADQQLLHALNQ